MSKSEKPAEVQAAEPQEQVSPAPAPPAPRRVVSRPKGGPLRRTVDTRRLGGKRIYRRCN